MPSEKRENLNGTEITTPTPEKKGLTKIQKYIAIAAIGILIGGGIVGGIVASVEKNNHSAAAASTEATQPTQTVTETTAETATAAENALKQKVEKYAEAMKKYRAMSVDEFQQLPPDEQILYAQYIIDRTVESGSHDGGYGEGAPGHDFAVEYSPVSIDNSGQEIVDNFLFVRQISLEQLKLVEGGTVKQYNIAEGIKCLSAAYYRVGEGNMVSNNYESTISFMKTLTQPVWIDTKYKATYTSNLIDSVDLEGNKIQSKNITHTIEDGNTFDTTFIFRNTKDYSGENKPTWLFCVTEVSR